jgi:hypothetical protein
MLQKQGQEIQPDDAGCLWVQTCQSLGVLPTSEFVVVVLLVLVVVVVVSQEYYTAIDHPEKCHVTHLLSTQLYMPSIKRFLLHKWLFSWVLLSNT